MVEFERKLAEAKAALRRQPVHSLSDLWGLNPDEIVEGYKDGFENFPCSDNRSRAYWHGWRNAQIDRGHIPSDWQSDLLAREIVARSGDAGKAGDEHREKYAWLKSMGLADDGEGK